jgi:hypothetical protein
MSADKEVEQLLAELKDEREKYTKADDAKMKRLCDRLVELGHYPAKTLMDRDPLSMVESYGVDWNVWQEPLTCQHCNADMRDHVHGPPFKREIGQYDIGEDRTVALQCPDCKQNIREFYRRR